MTRGRRGADQGAAHTDTAEANSTRAGSSRGLVKGIVTPGGHAERGAGVTRRGVIARNYEHPALACDALGDVAVVTRPTIDGAQALHAGAVVAHLAGVLVAR